MSPSPELVNALRALDPLRYLTAPDGDPPEALRDPGRRRVVVLRDEVFAGLDRGEGTPALPRLRTEAYRLASCSWEDPWSYGLVAWSEEAVAESVRIAGPTCPAEWEPAWSAWRTAWWIRRAAGDATPTQQAHHDLVMGILHLHTGHHDEAQQRIGEALPSLEPRWVQLAHRLWHAVALGDAF